MDIGVVYPVRFQGEEKPQAIEVAFRGDGQLLPGGSLPFLDEEEMAEAIMGVIDSLGWNVTVKIPMGGIWLDVKTGDGWPFHSSNFSREIPLGEGKKLVVYRKAINSCW